MWIKSVFISTYISALVAGVMWASWQLFQAPMSLTAWSVMLALLPALGFFVRLFVWPVARTSSLVVAPYWTTAAALLVLLLAGVSDGFVWAWVLVVGLGGWWAYQRWYSHFSRQTSEHLRVGQRLPRITLHTVDGQAVHLQNLSAPLLLMFYRGNWCPLCMAQIREIAQQYQALAERGVQTMLISNQPQAHTASLARRFDVPLQFLIDEDSRVAQQLNIAVSGGTPLGLQALGYSSDTTMPTVIMTDHQGTIIFCDQTDNYRVRPEPGTFLQAFDNWMLNKR